MRRALVITCGCLSLTNCDKQPDSIADEKHSSSSAVSLSRSSSIAREEVRESARSVEERFAEVEQLEGPEREQALASIAWDSMETDEPSAQRAFSAMSPGSREKTLLIQHFAARLFERQPEEVVSWALALEHPMEKSAAIAAIAVAMAETDPQSAAALLSEHAEPGHALDVAAVSVIQRWAAKSAPDAATWVTRFPESAVRQAGLGTVATSWLASDASAAFQWLDAMPASAMRQQAARAMQGVILTQQSAVRDAWLQHASPSLRSELDAQTEAAMKDVGNNIPPL